MAPSPLVGETIERSRVPRLVKVDLGPLPSGTATAPRLVRADNGLDYVIKCHRFARNAEQHRYLAANEWISALLAMQCEYRTLMPLTVIRHEICLSIGWPYLPPPALVDVPTSPRILNGLENPDALYHMAVLDALIRNTDRHIRNIMVVRTQPPSEQYTLVLHDHDNALMCPGVTPARLDATEELDDPDLWIRAAEIRRRITDMERLRQTVTLAQDTVTDEAIDTIVRSTPSAWLPIAEQDAVVEFLVRRRQRLEDLVDQKARGALPHLYEVTS